MLALDLINTVALAGVVLFVGYGLRRAIPVKAFLTVPLVGAFFIDFANAMLITAFLNAFR